MSELPQGWAITTIGDINEYAGKNIDPKKAPEQVFELYSVPVFPTGKPEYLSGKEIGSTKQTLEPDDVLLCKINPRINRVWLVKQASEYPQVGSSEWIVIRQPKLHADFLRYQLCESGFRDRLCAEVSGVGGSLTRAQPRKVATYSLSIPPLAEQTRIAEKLDELLAQVDTLKARIDRIPAILKRFRQSVLAAAVSGRLTEEWRIQNYADSDTQGWKKCTLPELGELSRGKSRHRPRNDPRLFGDKYPFIQTGEVAKSSGRISSASKFYSEFGLEQSRLFPQGTLCITIAANIADTAILDIEACFPDSVVGFIANKEYCETQFIKYLIDVNKNNLESFAPATAQKNINLKILSDLRLPMPSKAEQTEIVRRVEQLFAYADQLEAAVNNARARIDRLTQSILAKAFRGELVPQDPNDEPASVLLERIRTERTAQTKPRRNQRKTAD